MSTAKKLQARIRVKTAMIRMGVSLGALAERVNHDPSVVSKAINHGRFPRVMAKIRKELRCA